jgi:hypothetical protein
MSPSNLREALAGAKLKADAAREEAVVEELGQFGNNLSNTRSYFAERGVYYSSLSKPAGCMRKARCAGI